MTAGVESLKIWLKAIPPSALVVLSILSIQVSSVLAKYLFAILNPVSVTFVRVGLTACLLLFVSRPQLGQHQLKDYFLIFLLGTTFAGQNLSFYAAISRIPLGIAVSLAFIGPLGVAVLNSRKFLDLLWVICATTGIVLLTPTSDIQSELTGIIFALIAATCWGAYILLAKLVGQVFSHQTGLVLAMIVATVELLPLGVILRGSTKLHPLVLIVGSGIAILGTAVPYALEFQALKQLSTRIFGVLLSLEPVVATLIGFVFLGEKLEFPELLALALISLGASGATLFGNNGT